MGFLPLQKIILYQFLILTQIKFLFNKNRAFFIENALFTTLNI